MSATKSERPGTPFAPIPLTECALARAASVIGDAWTLLILREAIHGVTRFDQIHGDLGIPRAVLSKRLKALVAARLFEKTPVKRAGRRSYDAYVLSTRGRALIPALIALGEWGDHHLPGPPSRLGFRHGGCGGVVHSALVCECGQSIDDASALRRRVAPRNDTSAGE
ncbi:MAG: winged helix-turn-helix transcriptional regulator [Inquilinaceae bacterium]